MVDYVLQQYQIVRLVFGGKEGGRGGGGLSTEKSCSNFALVPMALPLHSLIKYSKNLPSMPVPKNGL